MIANIKLPNASVPKDVVDARIRAPFQGAVLVEGSFLWKYHWAVIADKENLHDRKDLAYCFRSYQIKLYLWM